MHRTDYDFDVISGPSTPPPSRLPVFRPAAPRPAPDSAAPAEDAASGAEAA